MNEDKPSAVNTVGCEASYIAENNPPAREKRELKSTFRAIVLGLALLPSIGAQEPPSITQEKPYGIFKGSVSITGDDQNYGVGTLATYTFGENKKNQFGHLGIKQPGVGWDKFVGKSFWYSREVAQKGKFSSGVEGIFQHLPNRNIIGAGFYGQITTDPLKARMTWVKPVNINAPQYILIGGNVDLEKTIELTGLNVPKLGSIAVNGFVNIGEKSERVLDQRGVRIGRIQYTLPFSFGRVQPLLEYNYQGPANAHSYAAGVAINLSRRNK